MKRLLVLSKHEGQYLSEIQYLLSVIQCLNFQVVLFVFSILSFSDSFYDDFGEKISFCETCKENHFLYYTSLRKMLPLKDFLRLSLKALQYK